MADNNYAPDIISEIGSRIKGALLPNAGTPQAYTRVTRTPVRWSSLDDDTYGAYYPDDRAIKMNADKLPQTNPNSEYMSNILRHEQVHALLPPQTVAAIKAYFDANPELANTGRAELSRYAPDAGGSNKGLAQEAPAYAVQGYRFGMPNETVDQYLSRMPADVQAKYRRLMQGVEEKRK